MAINRKIGVGRVESGRRKIAVAFESELFDKIRTRAEKKAETVKTWSFSKEVADLCKVGILDLDESDKHEA